MRPVSEPIVEKHREAYFTEANLANLLVKQRFAVLGVRWARGFGWMRWTEVVWQRCDDSDVVEIARQWALSKAVHALTEMKKGNEDKVNADAWIRVAGTAGKLRSIVGLTRGIDGVRTEIDELDAHPDLLNTPSGVVDLTTGELRKHDKSLLLTRSTGVDYVPDATHPDWDAALRALPDDVRWYAQLRYGQAVTGHMAPDDVLLVQQGAGENGKTTVMSAIAAAIGDFYTHVSDRVLLANPGDHPTEFMDLRGSRLALIEETPEARRLSVARLKKVVGTKHITARHIRQDDVTFAATHSLIVSTNYLLNVEETDHGTWRRLLLLRFPYRFRKAHEALEKADDRRGDPQLRYRLAESVEAQQAALRWLVDGAVAWYELGRVMPEPPARVDADTKAWRQEADQILAYVDERLVLDPSRQIMTTELLADFNDWIIARGQRALGDKTFVSRFVSHDALASRVERKKARTGAQLSRRNGFAAAPPASCWVWQGIRFREPADDAAALPRPANTGPVPAVPALLVNA